jgi:hypothetical protein
MTTQTGHRLFDRAQRKQDILLASSFCLWAMLIGVSPVLAFRALIGS